MTLEEAILHCEEVAKENIQMAKNGSIFARDRQEAIKCLECAEEHHQLAEWLKELKFYREIKNSWNRMFPNGEEVNADDN